ncbi:hypothetical protein Palpr_1477 [Paludibacter propionicigenes WB4]|uniref:DUF3822 domain-containing protein n=1 Tax=Paludibacter propionicigenes (strain DSM 17365 / JCM 13257 / WB4) TaxID=694427 RepID=E4T4H9_PALPW|nr:DUF3822 family protein [Paludibacter propionicigenes]ADQ79623.1 hypothetical protein Palpr_1477 [Paludibacter propionicigenes WB4]
MELHTDSTTSHQYSLSIRITLDGFSLSIADGADSLISSKTIPTIWNSLSVDEITQLVKRETQLNYRNIRLIYESDFYTFVPAPIFRSNEAEQHLNFQEQKTLKNDIVLYNYLPVWDTVSIFAIPKTIQVALSQLFPNTIIEHHTSYFLSAKVKTQHENAIFIWTRQKKMDVITFKNGKLYLLNSYSYQTAEDFTYHTLNIIDKLSIDTDKCKVYLFNAEKKQELKNTLEKYLDVNGQ